VPCTVKQLVTGLRLTDTALRCHRYPMALGVTLTMKRRAAIEPGIGHLKAEHRLERSRLWGEQGDMVNAILSAAGMNFRKLLRRAAAFCRAWMAAIEVFEILMSFRGPPQIKGQFA